MTGPTDEKLDWLAHEYLLPRKVGGDHWVAIAERVGGAGAIVRGRMDDSCGWSDEWMYETLSQAVLACSVWNGYGDPCNWVRHKPSNRRISRSPDEVDGQGNRVGAVGVVYVRP